MDPNKQAVSIRAIARRLLVEALATYEEIEMTYAEITHALLKHRSHP